MLLQCLCIAVSGLAVLGGPINIPPAPVKRYDDLSAVSYILFSYDEPGQNPGSSASRPTPDTSNDSSYRPKPDYVNNMMDGYDSSYKPPSPTASTALPTVTPNAGGNQPSFAAIFVFI